MKNPFLLVVFSILLCQLGMAHGDHDTGHAKPPKGGILRSLETIHLELVHIDKKIQVYIYNKDKKPKPLNTKDYPISAKIILPRGKGEQPVQLEDKKDHWVATYDTKELHRFNLELTIEQGGHTDKVLFTIEPKK